LPGLARHDLHGAIAHGLDLMENPRKNVFNPKSWTIHI
jgi:hypothetical protein